VRVRIPADLRPSSVQLLTAGGPPRTSTEAGVMTVTVPSVELHEVIAIDL
jgi:hypothetical protein